MVANMKRCSSCKRDLDESNFHRNVNTKDGLHAYCKECIKVKNKERMEKYHSDPNNIVPEDTLKTCSVCKKQKLLSCFYKTKINKVGRSSYCIDCKKEYQKANAERIAKTKKIRYEKNKEHILQKEKERYKEKTDQIKQVVHDYYINNKEYIITQKREYRKQEHVKMRDRQWHKEYRETHREHLTNIRKLDADRINALRRMKNQTPEGKRKQQLKDIIRRAKKKKYGFKPINKKRDGLVFHHLHLETSEGIDRGIGIYIPAEIHASIWHNGEKRSNMDKINKSALLWLCEQSTI